MPSRRAGHRFTSGRNGLLVVLVALLAVLVAPAGIGRIGRASAAAATEGVSVSTSATPTLVSFAGQSVSYVYTVTNTGQDQITGLTVKTTMTAPAAPNPQVNCPSSTLNAGASQTCTATYDPIHTVQFGTWPGLSHLLTVWAPMVGLATSVVILVQVSFPGMLLRRGTRIAALGIMALFHASIGLLMGLPWFSTSLFAIDAIFIRDVTWQAGRLRLRNAWRQTTPAVA